MRQKIWSNLPAFAPQAAVTDGLSIANVRGWRLREPSSGRRYTVLRLETRGGLAGYGEGGPDGDNVDIYVQALDADTPRRLTTSPERERSPVWLRDGQHIGFLRDDGPDHFAVMVVPLQGAGERRVAELSGNLNGPPTIEWARDGKSIVTSEPVSPGGPLQIVEISLESGARRVLIPSRPNVPGSGTEAGVAMNPRCRPVFAST